MPLSRPRTLALALTAAALPLSSALVAAPATARDAAPTDVRAAAPVERGGSFCDKSRSGDRRNIVHGVTTNYQVVASKRDELSRGATMSITVTIAKQQTRTNDVRMSSELSASVKAGIFGGVEAKIGAELGSSTSTSVQRVDTITKSVTRPGSWVNAEGFVKYKVEVSHQTCARIGAHEDGYVWRQIAHGHVVAYDLASAMYRCGSAAPQGSFRAYLRARKCL